MRKGGATRKEILPRTGRRPALPTITCQGLVSRQLALVQLAPYAGCNLLSVNTLEQIEPSMEERNSGTPGSEPSEARPPGCNPPRACGQAHQGPSGGRLGFELFRLMEVHHRLHGCSHWRGFPRTPLVRSTSTPTASSSIRSVSRFLPY